MDRSCITCRKKRRCPEYKKREPCSEYDEKATLNVREVHDLTGVNSDILASRTRKGKIPFGRAFFPNDTGLKTVRYEYITAAVYKYYELR